MPESVRFETNVPVEIVLQREGGVLVAGRYSDRVMYTLIDDRRIYVPPYVAQCIRDLAIQPGERFHITKRQVKIGQRKIIQWNVERLDTSAETQLERDLSQSIEIAKAKTVNREPSCSETAPQTDSKLELPPFAPSSSSDESHRNGRNGHGPEYPPPTPTQEPDTQLTHALKTAIAAAGEAEKFAKTLDYNIRFTTDDVRSMGITILIGMQQRLRN
jgi:hypothetical protein